MLWFATVCIDQQTYYWVRTERVLIGLSYEVENIKGRLGFTSDVII